MCLHIHARETLFVSDVRNLVYLYIDSHARSWKRKKKARDPRKNLNRNLSANLLRDIYFCCGARKDCENSFFKCLWIRYTTFLRLSIEYTIPIYIQKYVNIYAHMLGLSTRGNLLKGLYDTLRLCWIFHLSLSLLNSKLDKVATDVSSSRTHRYTGRKKTRPGTGKTHNWGSITTIDFDGRLMPFKFLSLTTVHSVAIIILTSRMEITSTSLFPLTLEGREYRLGFRLPKCNVRVRTNTISTNHRP